MRNFDIVSKVIWEGLKNPKDNPCWKGYKPVGTKKKNGRTVPNCVPKESKKKLTENYFPVRTSFADLPDTAPYGFWVWGNKYVIAQYQNDHIKILEEIIPGEMQTSGTVDLQSKAFKLGLIRIAREGNMYYLNYLYSKPSSTALKLAHDIADFYGLKIKDDYIPPKELSQQTKQLPQSPDKEL